MTDPFAQLAEDRDRLAQFAAETEGRLIVVTDVLRDIRSITAGNHPDLDSLRRDLTAALPDPLPAMPVIRHCVVPPCLAEFDITGAMRSKSGDGWLQSTAVGYCCPDHSARLWADESHVPNWQRAGDTATLRCLCGWDSGTVAFRGHGTVLWQVHALNILKEAQS